MPTSFNKFLRDLERAKCVSMHARRSKRVYRDARVRIGMRGSAREGEREKESRCARMPNAKSASHRFEHAQMGVRTHKCTLKNHNAS